MKGFFNYDGPILGFLGKVADLIWLNVIMLFFSLPIVTIGAVQTAGQYAALKLKREEGHVFSNFWKSFKMNFGQSTLIWIILVLVYAINGFALYVSAVGKMPMGSLISGVILAALLFTGIMNLWVYPLQCRFDNKVRITIKNAFFMGFRYIFRTIVMAICHVPSFLFGFLFFTAPWTVMQFFPIWFMLGISVPIYWNVLMYNKIFERLEEQIMERENEGNDDEEPQAQLPVNEA